MEERVKRAVYLKREIAVKEALYDEDEREITRLNSELPAINMPLYYARQKISCFTMTIREMAEDVFSLELSCEGKDSLLDELKKRLKVLKEIAEDQINKERILNERVEEIEKRKSPREMRKIVLYEKLRELREEYEILLLEMDEDKVPEELRTDYENVREDFNDESIVELIEDKELEELEELEVLELPEVKTLFIHETCCACQEEKPNIFNIPCGHACLCRLCNTKNANNKCAICRRVVKIFYEMNFI